MEAGLVVLFVSSFACCTALSPVLGAALRRSEEKWSVAPSTVAVKPWPPPGPALGTGSQYSPDLVKEMEHFEEERRRLDEKFSKMFSNVALEDNWRLTYPLQEEVTRSDGSRLFVLQFDVRMFNPDEITVRTTGDVLSVYARRTELVGTAKRTVFREYHATYVIPKEVNKALLTIKRSPEGVLILKAPLPAKEVPRGEGVDPK